MSSSEFELIKKYFQHLTDDDPSVQCGIGDDAAIIKIPADMELALSVDTLLQDTHFPAQTDAYDIAYKSLAVNLSDMAAMGALPKWTLLSVSLADNDEVWLEKFAAGFRDLAKQHSVSLIGGDTSKGPLSITVQILGLVPAGTAVKRNGARLGDLIYVTGTLGDAGLGLDILNAKYPVAEQHKKFFLDCLNRPDVSVDAGLRLRNIASSAIDISDGLIADLGHILKASEVGAEIAVEKIPLSAAMQQCVDNAAAWNYALTSGDDYQLCFTAAAEKHEQIMNTFREIKVPVCCIGEITQGSELVCKDIDGNNFKPSSHSYQHF